MQPACVYSFVTRKDNKWIMAKCPCCRNRHEHGAYDPTPGYTSLGHRNGPCGASYWLTTQRALHGLPCDLRTAIQDDYMPSRATTTSSCSKQSAIRNGRRLT